MKKIIAFAFVPLFAVALVMLNSCDDKADNEQRGNIMYVASEVYGEVSYQNMYGVLDPAAIALRLNTLLSSFYNQNVEEGGEEEIYALDELPYPGSNQTLMRYIFRNNSVLEVNPGIWQITFSNISFDPNRDRRRQGVIYINTQGNGSTSGSQRKTKLLEELEHGEAWIVNVNSVDGTFPGKEPCYQVYPYIDFDNNQTVDVFLDNYRIESLGPSQSKWRIRGTSVMRDTRVPSLMSDWVYDFTIAARRPLAGFTVEALANAEFLVSGDAGGLVARNPYTMSYSTEDGNPLVFKPGCKLDTRLRGVENLSVELLKTVSVK